MIYHGVDSLKSIKKPNDKQFLTFFPKENYFKLQLNWLLNYDPLK